MYNLICKMSEQAKYKKKHQKATKLYFFSGKINDYKHINNHVRSM